MSGIVLRNAEIIKQIWVATGKLHGDSVYAFERDFEMLLHNSNIAQTTADVNENSQKSQSASFLLLNMPN